MLRRLEHEKSRLELAARALQTVSPLATLERGYSIVTTTDGDVVTNATTVEPGRKIEVRLAQGELSATVDDSRSLADEVDTNSG
jgi:exodeoxyribonuclease VII large subunit